MKLTRRPPEVGMRMVSAIDEHSDWAQRLAQRT